MVGLDRAQSANHVLVSEQWYIMGEGEEKLGPYEAEQMQQHALAGSLTSEHLVWTERLDSWVPASAVEGLLPVVQSNLTAQVVNPRSAAPSALLDPSYHTTARALRLIHFGSLLGILTATPIAPIWIIVAPQVPLAAHSQLAFALLALALASLLFFVIELIGHCMGFAPRSTPARACLGGVLLFQLCSLIVALRYSSDVLAFLLGDDLLQLLDALSLGAYYRILVFSVVLSFFHFSTKMVSFMLMARYMSEISISLGLPGTDASSFRIRIYWMLGTLALAAFLGPLALAAFCIQYILAYFNYLGLLSSTRQSIFFQQRRRRPL